MIDCLYSPTGTKRVLFGFLAFVFSVSFLFGTSVPAVEAYGEETFRARITSIEEGKCKDYSPEEYPESEGNCVKVTLIPVSEEDGNELFEIIEDVTYDSVFAAQGYKKGDIVFVTQMDAGENTVFSIVEIDRASGLIPLAIVFLIVVLVVARVRGATSLLGLGISIFAIFGLLVPIILKGKDPLIFGGLIALAILVASIYLSHGFNRKSTLALLGITMAIVLTLIIALIFSSLTRISGYGSEEAFFLVESTGIQLSMSKVFIASIILGTVGILDDVAVNQVGFIRELKKENPSLDAKELFSKSMALGRDHIASMINTLFLVYAGASLPLVLLFKLNGVVFGEIIHYEQFAEEIVRTIVGSIGLVLAVPITAFIASESYAKKPPEE